MFCLQCGAEVSPYTKVCQQCGAAIDINNRNIKEEYVSQEMHPLVGLNGLKEVFLILMKRPIGSTIEMYARLELGMTAIYSALILIFNAIIGYALFERVIKNIVESTYEICDYLFGYGTVQYLMDEIGFTAFFWILGLEVLGVILPIVMVKLIYGVLFKQDIEWIEAIQLQLMPLTLNLSGRVCILILSLLNVKFAAVCFILLVLVVMTLNTIEISNRIGISTPVIYTSTLVYSGVVVIQGLAVFSLVKNYLQ